MPGFDTCDWRCCVVSQEELEEDRQLMEMAARNSPVLWRNAYHSGHEVDEISGLGTNSPESMDVDFNPTFGLLPPATHRCYMQGLSDEILQQIFGNLPMLDLLFVVSRVCRKFNRIIGDPKFLQWKKLYYKCRYNSPEHFPEVEQILEETGLSNSEPEGCIVSCFLYIHEKFKRNRDINQRKEILERMDAHPLFAVAASWVDRCIWPKAMQRPSVWVYVSCIAILSESPQEIFDLFRMITASPVMHGTMPGDVTECFYCLATLMLIAHRELKISPRIHYTIFTAVSFCENTGMNLSLSVSGMPLTFEQQRIINYRLQPGDCIRIIAYAGTGKTTTLMEYAKANPRLNILVLMFNRAVADEAKSKFPTNAKCFTVHSFAWREVKKWFGEKITMGSRGTSVGGVLNALPDKHLKGFHMFRRAEVAKKTLTNFFASADKYISAENVPLQELGKNGQKVWITSERKRQFARDAEVLWEKMKNNGLPLSPDGVLKLYQLSNLPFDPSFHVLLVDEAQDMNPAMLDALRRFNIPKIFVGDPNQQIYSFRGAVNALALIPTTKTFYLTKSFRFGPEIAYLANCWLVLVKEVKKKILLGSQNVDFHDGTDIAPNSPLTIIARRNETIFDFCVNLVTGERPRKVHIVGGLSKFRIEDILAIHWLMLPPEDRFVASDVDSELVTKYDNFDSFWNTVKDSYDNSYAGVVRIVKKYTFKIPEYVRLIKQNHVSIVHAERVLATVHKAKGMEFDVVQLADDFPTLTDIRTQQMQAPYEVSDDEVNLLYVAMTRAKKSLILNRALYDFMRSNMFETFEIATPMYQAKKKNFSSDGDDLKCLLCQRSLSQLHLDAVVLYRKSIAITRNMKIGILGPGVICPICATNKGSIHYRFIDPETKQVVYQKDGNGLDLRTSGDYSRRLIVPLLKVVQM